MRLAARAGLAAPRSVLTVLRVMICVGMPGVSSVGNSDAAQVEPFSVISETDLGRVKLRLRRPQQIDAGNVLLELLEVDDYRVPRAAGATGSPEGHASVSVAAGSGIATVVRFHSQRLPTEKDAAA